MGQVKRIAAASLVAIAMLAAMAAIPEDKGHCLDLPDLCQGDARHG